MKVGKMSAAILRKVTTIHHHALALDRSGPLATTISCGGEDGIDDAEFLSRTLLPRQGLVHGRHCTGVPRRF